MKIQLVCALLLASNLSCKKDDDDNKDESQVPAPASLYADESKWLCLPGRGDVCNAEPSASEFAADGTFLSVAPNPAVDESVDCFYVHPTSDLSVKAGNSENFEYLDPVEQLAQMQIAPFKGSCRIFAPLYHQVTIGTYALPEDERAPYLNVAASDIRQAFEYYMANYNGGRKIAFVGHSQGSEMITRLLQEKFDNDAAMREKLLIAIIPGFAIHVKINETKGGTFQNIPACSTAGEMGCVISYRSYKEGTVYLGDGTIALLEPEEELCVNPVTLDQPALTPDNRRTATATLSGTLLPPSDWVSNSIRLVGSPSPFMITRGTYSAACTSGPDPRNRYLAIKDTTADADVRHDLVQLDSEALSGLTGLHTLDLQFPSAELVALVRARR